MGTSDTEWSKMRRMPWVSEEDKYVPYGGVILVDVGLLEEKPHLGKWLQFHRENQYIDEKFNEAPVLDEDKFIFVTPVDANARVRGSRGAFGRWSSASIGSEGPQLTCDGQTPPSVLRNCPCGRISGPSRRPSSDRHAGGLLRISTRTKKRISRRSG